MARLPFLLDIIGGVLILTIMFSQLVLPLWNGTRLFPWFNKRRNKLEADLVAAREDNEMTDLERRVAAARERVSPPQVPRPEGAKSRPHTTATPKRR